MNRFILRIDRYGDGFFPALETPTGTCLWIGKTGSKEECEAQITNARTNYNAEHDVIQSY